VPDLRPALATSDPGELADLLELLDVAATYDNENRKLVWRRLSRPNAFRPNKDLDRPNRQSANLP